MQPQCLLCIRWLTLAEQCPQCRWEDRHRKICPSYRWPAMSTVTRDDELSWRKRTTVISVSCASFTFNSSVFHKVGSSLNSSSRLYTMLCLGYVLIEQSFVRVSFFLGDERVMHLIFRTSNYFFPTRRTLEKTLVVNLTVEKLFWLTIQNS